MFIRFLGRPLHAPDADDPAGTGDGDGERRSRASDVLEQYGRDALRLAEKLADAQADNYGLREKNRTLRQQVTDLSAKLPAEGSTVLSADDARALETYRALGTPDALKAQLDGIGPVQQELAGLKRRETLTKAAEAAGFKPGVLAQLAGDLEIQTKPGADGKAQAVVVKDGKETPLTDYAKTAWADFLPALAPQTQAAEVYDINAGSRGGNGGTVLTDEQRQAITRRYQNTF